MGAVTSTRVSHTEIEMMAVDEEQGDIPVQQKKSKSNARCCGLIRTPLQYVPVCGMVTGLSVAVLGAIEFVAGQTFNGMSNPQPTFNTMLEMGIMIGGGIAVVTSAISFGAMYHLKPEHDLEGQIKDLHQENIKLGLENEAFKEQLGHLKTFLEGYKAMLVDHQKQTEVLSNTFSKNEAAMQALCDDFQQKLDAKNAQIDQVSKGLHAQTQQAKALSDQMKDTNEGLKETLVGLNVDVKEMAGQEKEWDEDIDKLSHENDAYKQNILQFQRMTKILSDQLAMIQQMREALAQQELEFTAQIGKLRETHDLLESDIDELRKMNEDQKLRIAGKDEFSNLLIETMTGLHQALSGIMESDEELIEKSVLQPLLDTLSHHRFGAGSSSAGES